MRHTSWSITFRWVVQYVEGYYHKIKTRCNMKMICCYLTKDDIIFCSEHIFRINMFLGWNIPKYIFKEKRIIMMQTLLPLVAPPGWHNIPADTLRNNDIVISSNRRHFDLLTSKWRRFDVLTTLWLHHVFGEGFPGILWECKMSLGCHNGNLQCHQ